MSDSLTRLLKGATSLGAALGVDQDELARLVDLGRAKLQSGYAQDAERVFRGLCALEPKMSSLHELHALALEALGKLDDAEDALCRALHLAAPEARAEIYAARGILRVKRADASGALTDMALARPTVFGVLREELDRMQNHLVEVHS